MLIKPARRLIKPTRRKLLLGAAAAICAPAIARAQFSSSTCKIGDPGFCSPRVVSSGGSVVLDATGTESRSPTSQTAYNYPGLTVGTANAIILLLAFDNQSVSGITAVWDSGGTNQSLTQIVSQATSGANGLAQIWGLIASPVTSGNKTLAISWTGAAQAFAQALSFSGVNSTFGTAFTGSSNSGVSNTASVTFTVAANHAGAGLLVDRSNNWISTSGGTQLFIDNGGAIVTAAGVLASGAGPFTPSATSGGSDNWAAVGVDISA